MLVRMTEKRGNLVPLVIFSELALAVIALVWGYLRELNIELGVNMHSILLGVVATLIPLSLNLLLFGKPADTKNYLKQFAVFRDEIATPLVVGLGGQQILLVSVLAGIGEELLFRGVIQSEFGIHVSVLLFALLHFGPEIRRFYLVFLVYLIFGYLFSGLFLISGGLLAPIVCHALYDYLAIRWLERRIALPSE